jgi:aminoglycoside phosphotransferase (APT) family kinase protein
LPVHANERPIDVLLVRDLIDRQFPVWRHLPVTPVESAGTDNALFRLGKQLAVRLPRIPGATGQIGKEFRWLPLLAPHLPLPIPVPVAQGKPDRAFPWPWGVYRWLGGKPVTLERLYEPTVAARDLAGFVRALQSVDASGGPLPGDHNSGRGVPLAERDAATRNGIAACAGLIDATAATRRWETALAAPAWTAPPVWVHGDLQPGNLLQRIGIMTAVIDFGCLGVGDPAVDLLPAWYLFPPAARDVYRQTLGVDEATWLRGMGWALSVSVIALPYYLHTNPGLVAISRRAIAEVLTMDA